MTPSGSPPNFRDAVCRAFQCPAEAWREVVFARCLYPHAALPARLLRLVNPSVFDPDLKLIEMLATCTDSLQVQTEVKVHRRLQPARGALRRRLRIRLSGQRLINLGAQVLPPAPPAQLPPRLPPP